MRRLFLTFAFTVLATFNAVLNFGTQSSILFGFQELEHTEGTGGAEAELESQSDEAVGKHSDEEPIPIFDPVVDLLKKKYFDKEFRNEKLEGLVSQMRPLAAKAKTLQEYRQVTHQLLSRLPATHMGLLSKTTYDHLMGELFNKVSPTFGFELSEYDGMQFAHSVLEGGPAEKAGLHPGDRIVSIDGVLVEQSERLDWRSDDAYLPDPPIRSLLCSDGDEITVKLDRGWGKVESIVIKAEPYSAYKAAKASAHIIEKDGHKFAYIHFWFIHVRGVPQLLKEKLENEFKDCDLLILDLRGRGGSASEIRPIIDILKGKKSTWQGPNIALIDRNSRSAKEVIARILKEEKVAHLVGQKTAGAVIPATFVDVGSETYLMFPTFTLGEHTTKLEGHGVSPHVVVETWRPYRGGRDPILEAAIAEAIKIKANANKGDD